MREHYVDDQTELLAVCQELRSAPYLAVDTEFLRDRTYYPQLCLVQLAGPKLAACVDPLALTDLTPLLDLLVAEEVVKVVHAGSQDLEIFYQLSNRLPRPLFDTQLAATLTGFGDQIGYSRLVEALLGVVLDKRHTRTDWSQRPLSEEQLRYALNDVTHLGNVYVKLRERLQAAGRLEWLAEDFEAMTTPQRYRNDPEDAWQRIGTGKKLDRERLTVLRQLAAWRERRAQRQDRPRRWVLADDALVAIARSLPGTRDRLAAIRGVPAAVVRHAGDEILAVVREGRSQEWVEESVPTRSLTPAEEAIADLLMAIVRLRAAANGLAAPTLAGRRELEALVTGSRELAVLRGWRRRMVGDDLVAAVDYGAVLRLAAGHVSFELATKNAPVRQLIGAP